MDIEQITFIENFLKENGGIETILNIEKLIVVSDDFESVNKLKESAYLIQKFNENFSNTQNSEEKINLKETWTNLFSKQVRFSVERVKKIKNKSN